MEVAVPAKNSPEEASQGAGEVSTGAPKSREKTARSMENFPVAADGHDARAESRGTGTGTGECGAVEAALGGDAGAAWRWRRGGWLARW